MNEDKGMTIKEWKKNWTKYYDKLAKMLSHPNRQHHHHHRMRLSKRKKYRKMSKMIIIIINSFFFLGNF